MNDFTPGSYFPSSYYAPSYFGGELSGSVNIFATITASVTVAASLTFAGQAEQSRSGGVTKRKKRKQLYYAEIEGKRIFGTANELDDVFAAYRAAKQVQKVVPLAKPKKVAAKVVQAPVGTPVLDALTAIARFEERERIAQMVKSTKEAYARMLEEEDETLAILLAA